jgi:hypothetical protein
MELESLRRQTRRVHLWTTAALIGIVIVGVSAILTSLCHLTQAGPKQDAFLSHLGTRLQRDVLPAMGRLADPSVKRLKPAVEAELKRLDRRAPDVAEAGLRELSILGRNLPARSGLILQQTLGKALEAREERLRQALPGVTDQQIVTLLDSLQLEAQDQLLKSGEKLFNPHLNSIQSILANLEKIETTEPVDVKEDVNSWQVAFLFLDVFTREFKDLAVTETAQLEDPEQ